MKTYIIAAVLLLCVLAPSPLRADALTDALVKMQDGLTVPLTAWKVHQPDVAGGEQPNFDDSAWQIAPPEYTWHGPNTNVWFRTRLVIPPTINGLPTNNAPLRLKIWVDDDGDVFVNGKFREHFHWDEGNVTLAEHVQPGQVYTIAVRGINGPGDGTLHSASLNYGIFEVLPGYQDFLQEADFAGRLAGAVPTVQQPQVRAVLQRAEGQVDQAAMRRKDLPALSASLLKAHQTLMTLKPMTRDAQVFYVGHAHIDMNWLWPWPETVDVCHRTWDSAMNLMDRFPDFGFVQSQPGAYAAIQQAYPDELTRMQRMSERRQWETVGGLWDESDTNMPSGEGLARSLFLGQRYFKTYFGHYATTGWLPDSFGHSWQMPQLMQGAGITDFYHMRCGDGVKFSWWQSPDGSRVLKANTDSYDTPITGDQMTQPWANDSAYGVKQSLVVFGVGDHGGGPTRQQIEQGKAFQQDPLLPQVKFVTADAFFRQLRAKKQTQDLPVIDHDLQYIFVGCYTAHADLKKSVRAGENALYAGEVFSSLAAMRGQPYPAQGFTEAWKPTAFAQFHDIMCGTAIHSTYDWMHQQLAPAEAFERTQTQRALDSLTAQADTQGGRPGEQPVVVWNALSFPRTDVVRVSVSDAARYHSLRDAQGQSIPAQALDDGTLTFVAPNVPAFGHRTYFLSTDMAPPVGGLTVHTTDSQYTLENDALRVSIDRATGLMTELYDKKMGRQMLAPGQAGNTLQLLGDSGSAWNIDYTGKDHLLTEPDAQVSLLTSGPVSATVRVKRTFSASSATQDITLYGNLNRVDVPTTVDWHEHGQLLKVAFPLDMTHPAPRVGIPYGSIDRPDNGQENPGQKWMDVTETQSGSAKDNTPLDLQKQFNQNSAHLFDGQNFSFDPSLFPAPGLHTFGRDSVAFEMPVHGGPDNIACAGQTLRVPAEARGDTLYLLGVGAPGDQGGQLTFVQANGRRTRATFTLGDWVVGGATHNDTGVTFSHRLRDDTGAQDTAAPHLWIVPVSLPAGSRVTQIILPNNPQCHIFAATIAHAPLTTPLFGLSVLNDSKYGSDTNKNVFRLTLLRSSNDPDPNPDEGVQTFTYALLPHGGDWRTARSEQAGLALNIPLRAVPASPHAGTLADGLQIASPDDNIVTGALKHCEDGPGYILRVFETQGKDTTAMLTFPANVRVQETDLLERPVNRRRITVQGRTVRLPIGHDQIVTLHITGLPDAGTVPLPPRAPTPIPVVNGSPAPNLTVLTGPNE